MQTREAIRLAAEWTAAEAAGLSGFCGAYLSGSVVEKTSESVFDDASDVDLVLVLQDTAVFPHRKFRYKGVLLEVTPIAVSELGDTGHVLCTHYLAWAMARGCILADPCGLLEKRHREAASLWQKPPYVRARMEGFLTRLAESGMCFQPDAPLQDKVTAWAFGAGIAVFPILTAAGCNCTVRRRFSAVRAVLRAYGEEAFCAALTGLLTGPSFDAAGLPAHMDALERLFDLAAASEGPSAHWRFRCEISADTRRAAITDTRRIVLSGHPEDAVFWMLATFSRCLTVLWIDDRVLWAREVTALSDFAASLGIHTDADIQARRTALCALLPEIRAVSERILSKRQKNTGDA
ncbi:MAG: hypothetical protein ACI4GO_10070 [Hominenteromicrobium sp.]